MQIECKADLDELYIKSEGYQEMTLWNFLDKFSL